MVQDGEAWQARQVTLDELPMVVVGRVHRRLEVETPFDPDHGTLCLDPARGPELLEGPADHPGLVPGPNRKDILGRGDRVDTCGPQGAFEGQPDEPGLGLEGAPVLSIKEDLVDRPVLSTVAGHGAHPGPRSPRFRTTFFPSSVISSAVDSPPWSVGTSFVVSTRYPLRRA